MQKKIIQDTLNQLEARSISLDMLTLDCFTLNKNNILLNERGLIINGDEFKGQLDLEFLTSFLQKTKENFNFFSTIDRSISPHSYQLIDDPYEIWQAKRIITKKDALNLLQGEFKQIKHEEVKFWHKTSIILLACIFCSFILFHYLEFHKLRQQNRSLSDQIALEYKRFFPNASHVINPRFRISQLLKSNGQGQSLLFWSLLDKLGKGIKSKNIDIEHIRFQNQVLSITLILDNFTILESLESDLQKQKMNVRQEQATSRHNKVVATLELTS